MYQSIIVPHFRKQLAQYVKKYRHLAEAVIETLNRFDPASHPHLGKNVFKVRVHSMDIAKGKNKSFRLMVFVVESEKFLVPVTLYFKGEQADMSKKELNDHLGVVLFELRLQRMISG